MTRALTIPRRRIWLRLLTGLLLFTCVILIFAGLLLKRGVRCDGLEIGGAVVSDIFLRWQDKLDLQIGDISLDSGQQMGFPQDFSLVDKVVSASVWGEKLFSRIVVRELKVGDMTASIHLDRKLSYITLLSEDLEVRSDIAIDGDTFLIDITKAVSKRFNSHLSGQIRINGNNEQASGSVAVSLGGVLPLTLDFTADPRQISFHGKEAGKITDIKPFVDLFGLDHATQLWITDYLTASRYNLKTFSGSFPWTDPMALMDSFYAEARVDDCGYTFEPGVEAVKAEYTDVVFSKGVLAITPHKSVFYGQDGDKSRVDINFNDPSNIILTVYILTRAVANQDILNLLNCYDISLPFKQTAGKTATDLTLVINLNTEDVTAHGTFVIDEGTVEYDQVQYDIKNARILLEDRRIRYENIHISFEKMFTADISGMYDAAKEVGNIDVLLQQFTARIKELDFVLDGTEAKPRLNFRIQPDETTLTASISSWKLGGIPLKLGAFSAPFSFQDISGVLPPTSLSIPPGISSKISGSFFFKELRFDFKCDLLKYDVNDLILKKSHGPFFIHFNKKLTIQSTKVSDWSLNQMPVSLYPSEFNYWNNIFSIASGRISYGEFFDSNVSGQFNHLSKQGTYILDNLSIKHSFLGLVLSPSDTVSVKVDAGQDNLLITIPELDMAITTGEDRSWSVKFANLASIHKYSPLMQRYELDAGQLQIVSNNGGESYQFSADIPYRYRFLVKDSITMDQYHVVGRVSGGRMSATINDDVQIVYDDELLITSRDICYDLAGIMEFIKIFPESDVNDKEQTGITCKIKAYDSSFILTPDRQALADQIDFEYGDNKIKVQLEHGPGSIVIDIEGKDFTLVGDDLNDVFMDALIPGSDFHSGTMSMAAKGSFDDCSALFKIEDTIVTDFTTLNNILALINTIPALITFNLPSYSTDGLPVDSIVAGMKIKDGVATFDSLDLESPELSMIGNGWIDFRQEKVEMDLNLITRAKRNINKIPLIGYILAGKEKRPSITVKVSGDLFNPDVEKSVFKEVVIQPFSMVYRTLALPGHLVSHMFGLAGDEQKVEKKSNGRQSSERIIQEEYLH